jgi:SHS family lactate transporter-like MFS transporter
MSGLLQGSWGVGFLLSSAAYGLLYDSIGWRGLLWLGILPALTVVYVRYFVKEPPVWVENRRRQREEHREVRLPLFSIFKRGMIGNTALACWWMAGGLVTYYSINAMFATHLQKDLGLSPAMIATPIIIANLVVFLSSGAWGFVGDRIGRRWAMIIPGLLGIPVAFFYMLSGDYWVIVIGYVLQGALLGGGAGSQVPSYMTERFPTEARATASAFCYHLGTIFGGIVPPVITYFAVDYNLGFSIPMLVGCVIGAASWCLALFLGPETKGKDMVPDLVLA